MALRFRSAVCGGLVSVASATWAITPGADGRESERTLKARIDQAQLVIAGRVHAVSPSDPTYWVRAWPTVVGGRHRGGGGPQRHCGQDDYDRVCGQPRRHAVPDTEAAGRSERGVNSQFRVAGGASEEHLHSRQLRLHEEFRRRVKTQGSLPSEDAALVLLFSLVASGQIRLRRSDGWRKIATCSADILR